MLKRIRRLSACPKCGSQDLSLTYQKEKDKMAKTCRTCGYGWCEEPLDK